MQILSVVMIRYVITDQGAVGSYGNDVIEMPPLFTLGKLEALSHNCTSRRKLHSVVEGDL